MQKYYSYLNLINDKWKVKTMTTHNSTSAVLESLSVPKALQSNIDGGFILCQTPDVTENAAVFGQKPETTSPQMVATQTKTDVGDKTFSKKH